MNLVKPPWIVFVHGTQVKKKPYLVTYFPSPTLSSHWIAVQCFVLVENFLLIGISQYVTLTLLLLVHCTSVKLQLIFTLNCLLTWAYPPPGSK